MRRLLASALLILSPLAAQDAASRPAADPWVVYAGSGGVGQGKKIVFLTGDEEYRSEEGMPQMARILARLGFHCTVLFAIDKKTGEIDPGTLDNIPGLEALDRADLMVIFTRFRDLPDAQMKHVVDYVDSGRPIVGLRTATHAFDLKSSKTYARFSWRNTEWEGGFGRQVLGETWIAHHGGHGSQSTRAIAADTAKNHPILCALDPASVWDTTDVYAVRLPLPASCAPIMFGQVLASMKPDAAPAPATKDDKTGAVRDLNAPMMPVVWTNSFKSASGLTARVVATTLGSSQGFDHDGTRRMLVNSCLWALGMDKAITTDLDVGIAGTFAPTPFGFGKHKKGIKPADLAWDVRHAERAK